MYRIWKTFNYCLQQSFKKVLRRLHNQFMAPLNKSISFPRHDFRILSYWPSFKIPKEKACKSCMKINVSPNALGGSKGTREQRMEKSVGSFKKSDNKYMKIRNWACDTRVDFLFCVLALFAGRPGVCSLPAVCVPLGERKEEAQGPTKLLRAKEKLAV